MEQEIENSYNQQLASDGYANNFSANPENKPTQYRPKHTHVLVGIIAIIILLLGAYQVIAFLLSFFTVKFLGTTYILLGVLSLVAGVLLLIEGAGMLSFKRWAVDLFIGQSIIGILILLYDLLFENKFSFDWQNLVNIILLVYFIFARKYFSVSSKYSLKFIYNIIAVVLIFVLGFSIAVRVAVKKFMLSFNKGGSAIMSVDDDTYYDLVKIKSWLMFYYEDQGYYPPGQEIILGGDSAKCLDKVGFKLVCTGAKYMSNVPESVNKNKPYTYFQLDGGKDFKILFEFIGDGKIGFGAGTYAVTAEGIDPEIKQGEGGPQEQSLILDNSSNNDSDSDGLSDSDEINIWKIDPSNLDTDNDGYSDGDEVKNGYDPKGPGKLNQ